MELAHWHRMTGTLFAFLRDNSVGDNLPEGEMDHLQGHYRHVAVRSLYIRSEFAKAVKALQAENIDVMALKGVALIGTAYKDAGTREMSDIDLLVKLESADRAQEIVTNLGYKPVGSEATQEKTRETHRHLPKLHDHDRELSMEVHTHFVSSTSPLHFDIESVWEHARTAKLHGVEVLLPSPEHMLLHLATHFFLDRRFTSGSSLKQLNDIAGYVRTEGEGLDWDFFLDEVKRHGLNAPVFSVLSTAAIVMDLAVPAHVLDGLRPADYSSKMEEIFIRQRVLQPHKLTATELVPHDRAYTLGTMLKGILRRVAPSGEYMETHYSSPHEIDEPQRNPRIQRAGEMFKRGFGYAVNPMRLWQEVRVDRWLHSLSSGNSVQGDERRPG